MTKPAGYETDFYAWATEQARLLRAGNLSDADIGNIAEELDSMGRAEKRELVGQLAVLLAHLLKWRFQQVSRQQLAANDRRATGPVGRTFEGQPDLKSALPDSFATAYRFALLAAQRETGLPEDAFPLELPLDQDQEPANQRHRRAVPQNPAR